MIARHPPIDPQTLARTILSEKRFRVAIPTTHRSLWEIFWSWLRDLWSRLADAFFSHVHVGSRAGFTIGVVIEAILIAAVVFIVIRLLAGVVRDARHPRSAARPLAELPDPQALYAQSRRAAAQGDYRTAIALVFRAALLRLERLGLVREDPSRTVNECRRSVAAREPALASAFDAIARPFTAAFYAELPVAQAQWLAAHDAYVALPQEERNA
jgi:hypothetical protein